MFTSLISGGLLGIVGSLFTNLFDFYKKKQEDKQKLALKQQADTQALADKRLDIEMMDKEYAFRESIADKEMEKDLQVSADSLQTASYQMDKATYVNKKTVGGFTNFLLGMVDVLRGLVRPVMTGYMVWEVHVMRVTVESLIAKAGIDIMTATVALGIYTNIVDLILFLASASFSWWFGTRSKATAKTKK